MTGDSDDTVLFVQCDKCDTSFRHGPDRKAQKAALRKEAESVGWRFDGGEALCPDHNPEYPPPTP